jgi:hypothetical protein
MRAAFEGATVNFQVSAGDGTLDSYTATTDSSGICSVTFTGGSSPTLVNVEDGDGYGSSASHTFGVIPPNYSLSVWGDQNPVPPGQTTLLRAPRSKVRHRSIVAT